MSTHRQQAQSSPWRFRTWSTWNGCT